MRELVGGRGEGDIAEGMKTKGQVVSLGALRLSFLGSPRGLPWTDSAARTQPSPCIKEKHSAVHTRCTFSFVTPSMLCPGHCPLQNEEGLIRSLRCLWGLPPRPVFAGSPEARRQRHRADSNHPVWRRRRHGHRRLPEGTHPRARACEECRCGGRVGARRSEKR